MIPSTSSDMQPNEVQAPEQPEVVSDYEDAVSSEEELGKLCNTLKNHLIQSSKKRKERKEERMLKAVKYQRSSSSEHSSLEKLQPGDMRARRGTGMSRRRTQNNSDSDHSDWRLLNVAFHEMAHYPLLVQLNEQLIEISKQLNDVEATNGLQLKIIMHLLHRVSKPRVTWFQSTFRFLKSIQFFVFAFTWPFVARIMYFWYLRFIRRLHN